MTGDDAPPKPLSESFSEIVILFAEKWNTTPFDVLAQDIDDFILVANTMIERGKNAPAEKKTTGKKESKGQKRIHVTDETATGGWY